MNRPLLKMLNRNQEDMKILKKHFTFGPLRRIQSDFNELLKISSFKRQLLRFLCKEYRDRASDAFLGKKVFYCAIDNACKKFYSEDGVLKFEKNLRFIWLSYRRKYACNVSNETR